MPAVSSAEETVSHFFPAGDYGLDATLSSGQVFRWRRQGTAWEGVVETRWVRLTQTRDGLRAEAMAGDGDWRWLREFLQVEVDLKAVQAQWPDDPPLRAAAARWPGLRLLRQQPWECLASFILSSNKQIIQIQQMVGELCCRYGIRVRAPAGADPAHAFPAAASLASCSEADLRGCRLGFRAPYLRETARRVAEGEIDLDGMRRLPVQEARRRLEGLPGVGRKIADCVLLFALGFSEVFPVDVWVEKALRRWYFARRRPTWRCLLQFAESHFGPQGGYAQQYLFHDARICRRRSGALAFEEAKRAGPAGIRSVRTIPSVGGFS